MRISKYTQLPTPERLQKILLSQASLDIIMNAKDDAWLRLTHYHKNYCDEVDMVKIDNGAGDHLYILFSDDGAIIKGFDHESPVSPYAHDDEEVTQKIYASVPDELRKLLNDPSIEPKDVTFCLWRSSLNPDWKKGDVPEEYQNQNDGEGFLLGLTFETADRWLDWAKSYYEEEGELIQLNDVRKVYAHEKITSEIIAAINPKRDVESVFKELKEIGYIT